LEANLVFIYSKLWNTKNSHYELRKQSFPLAGSIKVAENIKNKFKEISCTKGVEIYNTFKNVIKNNNGFR